MACRIPPDLPLGDLAPIIGANLPCGLDMVHFVLAMCRGNLRAQMSLMARILCVRFPTYAAYFRRFADFHTQIPPVSPSAKHARRIFCNIPLNVGGAIAEAWFVESKARDYLKYHSVHANYWTTYKYLLLNTSIMCDLYYEGTVIELDRHKWKWGIYATIGQSFGNVGFQPSYANHTSSAILFAPFCILELIHTETLWQQPIQDLYWFGDYSPNTSIPIAECD